MAKAADFKFSRDYQVAPPVRLTELVIPVPVAEWRRIGSLLGRCKKADRSFSAFAWTAAGVAGSALLNGLALAASGASSPLVTFGTWLVFAVSAVASGQAFHSERSHAAAKAENIDRVIEEMDAITSRFMIPDEPASDQAAQ